VQTMTQPRKLPGLDVLKKHVADGLTNKQIGAMYGATPEAVRLTLAKVGIRNGPGRPDHSRYVPWRVRADHAKHVLLRDLRAYSRRQQGLPLDEGDNRTLDEWIRFMEGDNPYGVRMSVHYDRFDPQGFWIEPEQEGDRDFVHPPGG
jgi:hypothetical protein